MAEKKRIAETKIVEKRMSKPQGTRSTVKPSDPIRSTTSRSGGAAAEAAAKPSGAQTQLSNFEAAMKQFHTRNFREARTLFEKAAAGPERDVANRASLHKSMCDRRLEQALPRPQVVSLASAWTADQYQPIRLTPGTANPGATWQIQ